MLQIIIPKFEGWDNKKEIFIYGKEQKLQLEHSLVSISKWESKWHKPFLTRNEKTEEETIDYIKCMTLTQNVGDDVYYHLTNDNMRSISEYIDNPMSAMVIRDNKTGGRDIITSEIIYYWMIVNNIPFECQKWHLNRLLTLIRVCAKNNQPKKKMSRQEILSRNAELNAARRKALNTKG